MRVIKWPVPVVAFLGCLVARVAWSEEGSPAPETKAPSERSTTLAAEGTAQFKFEYDNTDGGESREGNAYVEVRRLRAVLKGSVGTPALTYSVQVNYSPRTLELMDVYLNYKFKPSLQLLFGQAKVPFTRHRLNSYKDLTTIDWSYESRYFGAERQFGVMLHNGSGCPPRLEYHAGLYSGQNARASHAIGLANAFGESVFSPSNLVDPGPRMSVHPEFVGHIAYNHGRIDTRYQTDFEGGPVRFSLGLSGAWDFRPTERQDFSQRLAAEALVKARGFSLFGAYYLGLWQADETMASAGLGMTGLIVQASGLFYGKYELALSYVLADYQDALMEAALEYVDEQVAASDPEDAAAVASKYSDVGQIEAEKDLTLAFNIHIIRKVLKWQLDGSILKQERLDQDLTDYRVRSQLQLNF